MTQNTMSLESLNLMSLAELSVLPAFVLRIKPNRSINLCIYSKKFRNEDSGRRLQY